MIQRLHGIGLLLLVLPIGQVFGQGAFDRKVLDAVYAIDHPAVTQTFRASNDAFFPGVAIIPLVHWGVAGGQALIGQDPHFEEAYRLTIAEIGTVFAVGGIKNVIRRPRPYNQLEIESRSSGLQPGEDQKDPYSFPSGHAAVTFSIATSLTLSYPRWYVAVPLYAWATTVATTRVWLGVHYPTDVLAGAVLGSFIAWAVHHWKDLITPERLRRTKGQGGMQVHLRLSL